MKNLEDELRGLEWAARNPPVFTLAEGDHDDKSARFGWKMACEVYAGMLGALADSCRDGMKA